MPTYEYACRDCGEHLEVVQSFRDDPLTTCPGCEGRLRKVFSAAGIIFKGSGYYVTDSRTAPAEAGGTGDSSTAAKGDGGDKAASGGDKAASGGDKAATSESDGKKATPAKEAKPSSGPASAESA
jgi:putative FmdB family regulatory protein